MPPTALLRFAARLDALNALVLEGYPALLERGLPLEVGLLVTGLQPVPIRNVDGHFVKGKVLVGRGVVPCLRHESGF